MKCKLYLLIITGIMAAAACKKENDFINEEATGTGIHYYPDILNQVFVDTLTGKGFQDTLFSEGQQVVFEVNFFSQDSVAAINLYATPPDSARRKVQSIPYDPSFYSALKKADTVFLSYRLPDSLQTNIKVRLDVEVVTAQSLPAVRTTYL